MANILFQISGQKEILIFPPSEITSLSVPPGSSSSHIQDIFSTNLAQKGFQATLSPGDAVYIPPFWSHATRPLSASVGINVFWKNYKEDVYAGKDVYGNKDLVAYSEGRKGIERILRGFKGLDRDAKGFYLKRLAKELEEGVEL
jgi:Cupin-like domain